MSLEKITRLDLGSGTKKLNGYVSVDVLAKLGPDIVHDLNTFPYPFLENSVDAINMDNVLEHLVDPIRVIGEIHRILKVGGKATIKVPYFRSYWACIDPTHKHFFSASYFSYFDPDNELCKTYNYFDFAFKCNKVLFNDGLNNGLFKTFVAAIANRFCYKYELYLSHLFPLDEVTFEIEKI